MRSTQSSEGCHSRLAGPALGQIPGQDGAVSGYRTLPGPATVSGCQVAVPLMAQ